MSVRVVGYVDEALMARLVERATVEGRTLSNMVERLLSLGLGTVVTEREGTDAPIATALDDLSSRSVTIETCPKRAHHFAFRCDVCGWLPPREAKPDPREK